MDSWPDTVSFDLTMFSDYTPQAEPIDPEYLLDGYWESMIQARNVYKFFKDGTMKAYSIEPSAELTEKNLHYSYTSQYEIIGDRLIITNDGYQTMLQSVTPASSVDWERGVQAVKLPKDTVFFYETGFKRSEEDPLDYPFYIIRSEDTAFLMDNTSKMTHEQLKQVAENLGVPADLDVEYLQGDLTYWEGADRVYIPVQIQYNGEVIAGANVDPDTGELLNHIWMYSPDN